MFDVGGSELDRTPGAGNRITVILSEVYMNSF